jgi:hypothetical protein
VGREGEGGEGKMGETEGDGGEEGARMAMTETEGVPAKIVIREEASLVTIQ